jgi:hypothetical protein
LLTYLQVRRGSESKAIKTSLPASVVDMAAPDGGLSEWMCEVWKPFLETIPEYIRSRSDGIRHNPKRRRKSMDVASPLRYSVATSLRSFSRRIGRARKTSDTRGSDTRGSDQRVGSKASCSSCSELSLPEQSIPAREEPSLGGEASSSKTVSFGGGNSNAPQRVWSSTTYLSACSSKQKEAPPNRPSGQEPEPRPSKEPAWTGAGCEAQADGPRESSAVAPAANLALVNSTLSLTC